MSEHSNPPDFTAPPLRNDSREIVTQALINVQVGAWEGHAILDFLKENERDVKPDTIHADTPGPEQRDFYSRHALCRNYSSSRSSRTRLCVKAVNSLFRLLRDLLALSAVIF